MSSITTDEDGEAAIGELANGGADELDQLRLAGRSETPAVGDAVELFRQVGMRGGEDECLTPSLPLGEFLDSADGDWIFEKRVGVCEHERTRCSQLGNERERSVRVGALILRLLTIAHEPLRDRPGPDRHVKFLCRAPE
jgi:hypothetical protein